jgi:hypothetical protein
MEEDPYERASIARTAYHEAGHVVAHYLLKIGFRYATIIPSENALGCVVWGQSFSRKTLENFDAGEYTLRECDRVKKFIMVLLAGGEAEKEFINSDNFKYLTIDCDEDGPLDVIILGLEDLFSISDVLNRPRKEIPEDFFEQVRIECYNELFDIAKLSNCVINGRRAQEAYLKWLELETRRLITRPRNWLAVERVAEALLEKKTLTSKKARVIIRKALDEYVNSQPYALEERL